VYRLKAIPAAKLAYIQTTNLTFQSSVKSQRTLEKQSPYITFQDFFKVLIAQL
jgi:hypothetical protein